MLKNLLALADGRQITAGAPGIAIMSLQLTQSVNSAEELTLGSVCAAMVEVTLMCPGDCPIQMGDTFTLRKISEQKQVTVGIFTAEKPQRLTPNTVRITAYDNVTKLDRDLTDWLASLTAWPYTLLQLAQMVCSQCGVTLATEELPNGDLSVEKFTARGITGRQILQWIGQITGRFCRADAHGQIIFGWYSDAKTLYLSPNARAELGGILTGEDLRITGSIGGSLNGTNLRLYGGVEAVDDGRGNLTLLGTNRPYYFQGTLQAADYTVAPVQKVQLRRSEEDIGIIYPDVTGDANTYIITGNPLLATAPSETLLAVAQSLYWQLEDFSYTPCTVTVPAQMDIEPGDRIQITDTAGRTVTACIMRRQQTGQTDRLSCTGSAALQSTTAINNSTYRSLSGKVMQLQSDVDGLRVENSDAAGAAASLRLQVHGIETRVIARETDAAAVRERISSLQQDARGLQLEIRDIRDDGVSRVTTTTGYTFSEEGLRIRKSGQEMENLLDHTGMYVQRGGQVILQANNRGVTAVDVTAANFLVVGSHARFEDYNGGTACFYV